MGTVKRIGTSYYIEFEARGLKYQQKAGDDEVSAWKLLETVETKIRQGEMAVIVRDVPIDIFLNDFREHAASVHPAKTCLRMRQLTGHFGAFLNSRQPAPATLSQVTPKVIEDYKQHLAGQKNISPRLINFSLFLLREVLEYAIALGYLNDNPTLHTRFFAVSRRRVPRCLSENERSILLNGEESFRDCLELVLLTGLTAAEAVALKWTDIREERRCLTVRNRDIPLTSRAREVLVGIRGKSFEDSVYVVCGHGEPRWSEGRFRGKFTDFVQSRGLDSRITVAVLRHTFARDLLLRGVSLMRLCYLLGFDDIARVMRYEGFVPVKNLF